MVKNKFSKGEMIMKKITVIILLATLVLAMVACGGQQRSQTTTVDPNRLTYGADWSPADLNRVANKMVASVSKARWFDRARASNFRWILANEMANDSDEHINTRVIMEKIRTQLVNQQEVRFVDDQALNDILKQQNLQQSDLFNQASVVKIGKLSGSRLILRGRLSNMRRRAGLTTANVFQITLQVVDLETGDIRWTDEDQIGRINVRGQYR
jgi:hypothetical protein